MEKPISRKGVEMDRREQLQVLTTGIALETLKAKIELAIRSYTPEDYERMYLASALTKVRECIDWIDDLILLAKSERG